MLLEHGSQFTYAFIKILEFEPCFWFKLPEIATGCRFGNRKNKSVYFDSFVNPPCNFFVNLTKDLSVA